MSTTILLPVILGILVVIGLLFLFLAIRRPGSVGRIPNYRALFILGITWLPIGIATENTVFWIMGVVLMIIGLANRDKWGQETPWSELPPETRRFKGLLIVGLGVLLLVGGLSAWFFMSQ